MGQRRRVGNLACPPCFAVAWPARYEHKHARYTTIQTELASLAARVEAAVASPRHQLHQLTHQVATARARCARLRAAAAKTTAAVAALKGEAAAHAAAREAYTAKLGEGYAAPPTPPPPPSRATPTTMGDYLAAIMPSSPPPPSEAGAACVEEDALIAEADTSIYLSAEA